jgi:hypothetical protein
MLMKKKIFVRFQVLTAGTMNIKNFRDIAPYDLVGVDQRFRCAYCFHRPFITLMMEAVRTCET